MYNLNNKHVLDVKTHVEAYMKKKNELNIGME